MVSFAKHSCGDSRLACSDCGATVCPKCMVECPVGNRCKKCAAKTESHILKVTPGIAIRTFLVAMLAGFAFTFLNPFGSFSFYSWIIVYFVGTLVGNLIHRISGYKMGAVIVAVVIAGVALGAVANPDTLVNPIAKPDAIDALDYDLMQDVDMEDSDAMDGEFSGSSATRKDSSSKIDKTTTDVTDDSKGTNDAGSATTNDSSLNKADSTDALQAGADGDSKAVVEGDSKAGADSDSKFKHASELKKQRMKMRQEKARAMAKTLSSTRHFWKLIDLLVFVVGVLTPFTGIVPNFPFYGFRR